MGSSATLYFQVLVYQVFMNWDPANWRDKTERKKEDSEE